MILLRALLVLSCCAAPVFAQSTAPAGPPVSSSQSGHTGGVRIGAWGGPSLVLSTGSLNTSCNCSYDAATSIGITGGMFAGLPLSPSFSVQVRAGMTSLSTEYTAVDSRAQFGGSGEPITMTFERKAQHARTAVLVAAHLEWNSGGLYIFAGPAATLPLSDDFRETERIVTPGYVFDAEQSSVRTLADGTLGDIRPVRSMILAAHAGVGMEFPVATGLTIAPELSYMLPLQSILEDDDDWSLHGASLGLRIALRL